MKKFVIFLLIFSLLFTGAFAESPTLSDLYKAPSYISIKIFNETPGSRIRLTTPFLILREDGSFNLRNLYLIDAISIKIAEHTEEGPAEFTFPYLFKANEVGVNVFVYYNDSGRQSVIELGYPEESGSELVDISALPLDTPITMFIFKGANGKIRL